MLETRIEVDYGCFWKTETRKKIDDNTSQNYFCNANYCDCVEGFHFEAVQRAKTPEIKNANHQQVEHKHANAGTIHHLCAE